VTIIKKEVEIMSIIKTSGICAAVCSMVLVLLLGPASAVAPTTPTVCDELSDEKAYGFCNTFCEVLDCDWDPNASESACEALTRLPRFEKK
jgi:hypothetical protein